MNKMLIICPHLSTGGAPQFSLNKIELLKENYDIWCVEYSFVSPDFVVQRNKIIEILGDKFIPLYDNKEKLIDLINDIKPDIISFEEIAETFMDSKIIESIYKKDRSYKILESTHSSHDNSSLKQWLPDKFIFVSPWSQKMYSHFGVESEVIEYPVDIKLRNKLESQKKLGLDPNVKHIVNIGLFTPGKNQGYAFEIARKLLGEKVLFHFIGNQAGNFQDYWEPIMKNKPENCIIWGERSDADEFIKASDLFLFTSKFELNPLVVKEALCYEDLPIMMFNLETYMNKYDNIDNITYLNGSIINDTKSVTTLLNLKNNNIIKMKTRDEYPILLNSLGLKKGVEVGTFKGEFTKTIISKWDGEIYMVDVWRPLSIEEYNDSSNHEFNSNVYSEAMTSIKGHEDRCFMLRMKGEFAINLFQDESLDFIYIDANHSYDSVKEDMELWFPKLKKGGLFSGHDYINMDWYNDPNFLENKKDKHIYSSTGYYHGVFGVNPAVDEFCEKLGYTPNITDEWFGTWYFIK